MNQYFVATEGADPVALLVDVSSSGQACLRWYGDWADGAVERSPLIAPEARQRWGARLDNAPPAALTPGAGHGWPAAPALEYRRVDGAWRFEATEAELSGSEAGVRVIQRDPRARLAIKHLFTLDQATGALRVCAELLNAGDAALELRWFAVLSMPLPWWCEEVLETTGDWCAEFLQTRTPLAGSSWLREVREGRSSHRLHPGVLLCERGADARRGRVLGVQFAWSGDHRMRIDRLPDGRAVLQVGVLLHPGEIELDSGDRHVTPDLWLTCSSEGVDGVTARMHAFQRSHLRPARGQRWPRPVHLNTWEAVYFDHDPVALLELAEAGASVGIERFVLDDGWFLGRLDDRRALGDWQVDRTRYPQGLGPLVEGVNALGMEFGLWVEPEMVNDDSELARAHPNWIRGGGAGRTGRHQRVLDLGQAAVRDHLFTALDALLCEYRIGYLKWDHNRVLTDVAEDGTSGHVAQTLGTWALIDRLRAAHPDVEIESCASGGGRSDLGMLARTHRVWVSDCNDPVLRARIMAGSTPFLPPEVAGCHVGPDVAHTTGRATRLDFRAAVALLGAFGLEMDVRALDADERQRIAAWIALYKAWREVLFTGRVSTLAPDADHLVRCVTAPERDRAILIVLRLDDRAPGEGVRFALGDLDPMRDYRIRRIGPEAEAGIGPTDLAAPAPWAGEGTAVSGAWIASAGLSLQLPAPQRGVVFELIGV